MTLYKLLNVILYLLSHAIQSQTCNYHTEFLPEPMYGHVAVYSTYQNSVYMFGGKKNSTFDYNTVYKWDLNIPNSWFTAIDTTPNTTFFSYGNNAVIVNNIIYFIGMQDTTFASGNIYMFDITTESWLPSSQLQAPLISLDHGCLTTNDTHIFMVDGYNGKASESRNPVLQIYEISTDSWSRFYLPYGPYTGGYRYQYCSMVDNELFILGGRISNAAPSYTTQILKVDALAETISYVDNLPIAQSWGVAAYSNNFIYTIGGYPFNFGYINVFDVSLEKVTNIVYQMTDELSAPAAVILNNKLYIFGGEDNTFEALSSVQICELITNMPTTVPTAQPTTIQPTTVQPTTITSQPTTMQPTTQLPTTTVPTTSQPTTAFPTTSLPTTSLPTTALPTTITSQPTTMQSTTSLPTTIQPTTALPTTVQPTTMQPTTALPTTALPTTVLPTTALPTTSQPTTELPTTALPTTSQPSTTSIATSSIDRNMEITNERTESGLTNDNFEDHNSSEQDNSFLILAIVGISILCLILLFCILIFCRLKKSNKNEYESNSNQLSITNLQAIKSVSSQSPRYRITSPQSFKSNTSTEAKFVDDSELEMTNTDIEMQKRSETIQITDDPEIVADEIIMTPGAEIEGGNTNTYNNVVEGEETTGMEIGHVTDDGNNVNENDEDILNEYGNDASSLKSM